MTPLNGKRGKIANKKLLKISEISLITLKLETLACCCLMPAVDLVFVSRQQTRAVHPLLLFTFPTESFATVRIPSKLWQVTGSPHLTPSTSPRAKQKPHLAISQTRRIFNKQFRKRLADMRYVRAAFRRGITSWGDFNATALSAESSPGVICVAAGVLNWPQMCLHK